MDMDITVHMVKFKPFCNRLSLYSKSSIILDFATPKHEKIQ